MSLTISHGITGEDLLQVESYESLSVWDVMVRVAAHKQLRTPFLVVVLEDGTDQPQSLLGHLVTYPVEDGHGAAVLFKDQQRPTGPQYHALTAALCQKNIEQVVQIIEIGLDFSLFFMVGGWECALLTVAMLQDDKPTQYVMGEQNRVRHLPHPTASLTYLMLAAKADPNTIPPQESPTTMLGLAVALRNISLVRLLLEAAADTARMEDRVPPIVTAVLYQDKTIITLLLGAQADPWQETSLGVLQDRSWTRWASQGRESVSAMRIAAAQISDDTCLHLLTHDDRTDHWAETADRPMAKALSKLADTGLARVIEEYSHRTGLYTPRPGQETLYWRRLMAGLYFPPKAQTVKCSSELSSALRGWLDQCD